MVKTKKYISLVLAFAMVFCTLLTSALPVSAASSSQWVTVLETGGLGYTNLNVTLFSKASVLSTEKAKIEKGTVIKILGKSGDWYKAEVYPKGDKYIGYLYKNAVSNAFPVVGRNFRVIATSGLNIRSKMSSSSSKIGTLKYNANVYVIKTSTSGWSQIKYNGKTGYIATRYLKLT